MSVKAVWFALMVFAWLGYQYRGTRLIGGSKQPGANPRRRHYLVFRFGEVRIPERLYRVWHG